MGGGWSTPRPGRFTPGEDTRCPLWRRLGGPQDRSRRVRKISPPPAFDPRTVQPVGSRYTDWAIPAQIYRHVTKRTDWKKIDCYKQHETGCLKGKKVKQSRYRPGVAQRVPGTYVSQISWQRHGMVVGCQRYEPAAFTPRKYSWYSFLSEDESTPGP